jgi:hypothetical protein
MNALIAMAKRLSIVLDAVAQESGLWDFIPATAKNAQEWGRAPVLSGAGQAVFRHRHNQTDPLPARAVAPPKRRMADSLNEAKAALRHPWERQPPLSTAGVDVICSA